MGQCSWLKEKGWGTGDLFAVCDSWNTGCKYLLGEKAGLFDGLAQELIAKLEFVLWGRVQNRRDIVRFSS